MVGCARGPLLDAPPSPMHEEMFSFHQPAGGRAGERRRLLATGYIADPMPFEGIPRHMGPASATVLIVSHVFKF